MINDCFLKDSVDIEAEILFIKFSYCVTIKSNSPSEIWMDILPKHILKNYSLVI